MALRTPTVGELREHFPDDSRQRSYVLGLGLFLLVFGAVTGSYFAAVLVDNVLLKFLAASACGTFASVLFVLGHDACHSTLTPSAKLNSVLTRLCFLPALNPTTTWILGHNTLHHGFTNLRGMDYAYTPFTLEEFRALPWWRRGLERFYRTLPGIGFFSIFDVWLKHLYFPRPSEWPRLDKRWFAFDVSLAFLFLCLVTWYAGSHGWQQHGIIGVAVNISIAVVWAYLVFAWIFAFATLQQHTHPRVAWFDSKEEWTFFLGQVEGTVHVRMPRWLELFFHDVFDHTAHHVDPKIPVYKLHQAQQRLTLAYPEHITTIHTSPRALGRTLRACKLYDYRRHCWTDFEGNPTGDRILVPKESEHVTETPDDREPLLAVQL